MARVGVVITLVNSLQAKKSIFTSGAVRLTKNQFNVCINRSVVISGENIGEFCGACPHGTFSYSRKYMQVEVHRKGIFEYRYNAAPNCSNISISDKYTLTDNFEHNYTSVTYVYMDYNVSLEKIRGQRYVRVNIRSSLKTSFHDILIDKPTISMILDLNIPDYIKEPILKLKS
jgi:hypothetical protein